MTELRTLKDLVFVEHLIEKQLNELRQEAINHLKKLKESKLEGKKLMYMTFFEQFEYSEDWIKHFFNITEKDLK